MLERNKFSFTLLFWLASLSQNPSHQCHAFLTSSPSSPSRAATTALFSAVENVESFLGSTADDNDDDNDDDNNNNDAAGSRILGMSQAVTASTAAMSKAAAITPGASSNAEAILAKIQQAVAASSDKSSPLARDILRVLAETEKGTDEACNGSTLSNADITSTSTKNSQQYFANRIAESRQRALLSSIRGAVGRTLAQGGRLSTNDKPPPPASPPPPLQEQVKDKTLPQPAATSRDYFAARIAASRQSTAKRTETTFTQPEVQPTSMSTSSKLADLSVDAITEPVLPTQPNAEKKNGADIAPGLSRIAKIYALAASNEATPLVGGAATSSKADDDTVSKEDASLNSLPAETELPKRTSPSSWTPPSPSSWSVASSSKPPSMLPWTKVNATSATSSGPASSWMNAGTTQKNAGKMPPISTSKTFPPFKTSAKAKDGTGNITATLPPRSGTSRMKTKTDGPNATIGKTSSFSPPKTTPFQSPASAANTIGAFSPSKSSSWMSSGATPSSSSNARAAKLPFSLSKTTPFTPAPTSKINTTARASPSDGASWMKNEASNSNTMTPKSHVSPSKTPPFQSSTKLSRLDTTATFSPSSGPSWMKMKTVSTSSATATKSPFLPTKYSPFQSSAKTNNSALNTTAPFPSSGGPSWMKMTIVNTSSATATKSPFSPSKPSPFQSSTKAEATALNTTGPFSSSSGPSRMTVGNICPNGTPFPGKSPFSTLTKTFSSKSAINVTSGGDLPTEKGETMSPWLPSKNGEQSDTAPPWTPSKSAKSVDGAKDKSSTKHPANSAPGIKSTMGEILAPWSASKSEKEAATKAPFGSAKDESNSDTGPTRPEFAPFSATAVGKSARNQTKAPWMPNRAESVAPWSPKAARTPGKTQEIVGKEKEASLVASSNATANTSWNAGQVDSKNIDLPSIEKGSNKQQASPDVKSIESSQTETLDTKPATTPLSSRKPGTNSTWSPNTSAKKTPWAPTGTQNLADSARNSLNAKMATNETSVNAKPKPPWNPPSGTAQKVDSKAAWTPNERRQKPSFIPPKPRAGTKSNNSAANGFPGTTGPTTRPAPWTPNNTTSKAVAWSPGRTAATSSWMSKEDNVGSNKTVASVAKRFSLPGGGTLRSFRPSVDADSRATKTLPAIPRSSIDKTGTSFSRYPEQSSQKGESTPGMNIDAETMKKTGASKLDSEEDASKFSLGRSYQPVSEEYAPWTQPMKDTAETAKAGKAKTTPAAGKAGRRDEAENSKTPSPWGVSKSKPKASFVTNKISNRTSQREETPSLEDVQDSRSTRESFPSDTATTTVNGSVGKLDGSNVTVGGVPVPEGKSVEEMEALYAQYQKLMSGDSQNSIQKSPTAGQKDGNSSEVPNNAEDCSGSPLSLPRTWLSLPKIGPWSPKEKKSEMKEEMAASLLSALIGSIKKDTRDNPGTIVKVALAVMGVAVLPPLILPYLEDGSLMENVRSATASAEKFLAPEPNSYTAGSPATAGGTPDEIADHRDAETRQEQLNDIENAQATLNEESIASKEIAAVPASAENKPTAESKSLPAKENTQGAGVFDTNTATLPKESVAEPPSNGLPGKEAIKSEQGFTETPAPTKELATPSSTEDKDREESKAALPQTGPLTDQKSEPGATAEIASPLPLEPKAAVKDTVGSPASTKNKDREESKAALPQTGPLTDQKSVPGATAEIASPLPLEPKAAVKDTVGESKVDEGEQLNQDLLEATEEKALDTAESKHATSASMKPPATAMKGNTEDPTIEGATTDTAEASHPVPGATVETASPLPLEPKAAAKDTVRESKVDKGEPLNQDLLDAAAKQATSASMEPPATATEDNTRDPTIKRASTGTMEASSPVFGATVETASPLPLEPKAASKETVVKSNVLLEAKEERALDTAESKQATSASVEPPPTVLQDKIEDQSKAVPDQTVDITGATAGSQEEPKLMPEATAGTNAPLEPRVAANTGEDEPQNSFQSQPKPKEVESSNSRGSKQSGSASIEPPATAMEDKREDLGTAMQDPTLNIKGATTGTTTAPQPVPESTADTKSHREPKVTAKEEPVREPESVLEIKKAPEPKVETDEPLNQFQTIFRPKEELNADTKTTVDTKTAATNPTDSEPIGSEKKQEAKEAKEVKSLGESTVKNKVPPEQLAATPAKEELVVDQSGTTALKSTSPEVTSNGASGEKNVVGTKAAPAPKVGIDEVSKATISTKENVQASPEKAAESADEKAEPQSLPKTLFKPKNEPQIDMPTATVNSLKDQKAGAPSNEALLGVPKTPPEQNVGSEVAKVEERNMAVPLPAVEPESKTDKDEPLNILKVLFKPKDEAEVDMKPNKDTKKEAVEGPRDPVAHITTDRIKEEQIGASRAAFENKAEVVAASGIFQTNQPMRISDPTSQGADLPREPINGKPGIIALPENGSVNKMIEEFQSKVGGLASVFDRKPTATRVDQIPETPKDGQKDLDSSVDEKQKQSAIDARVEIKFKTADISKQKEIDKLVIENAEKVSAAVSSSSSGESAALPGNMNVKAKLEESFFGFFKMKDVDRDIKSAPEAIQGRLKNIFGSKEGKNEQQASSEASEHMFKSDTNQESDSPSVKGSSAASEALSKASESPFAKASVAAAAAFKASQVLKPKEENIQEPPLPAWEFDRVNTETSEADRQYLRSMLEEYAKQNPVSWSKLEERDTKEMSWLDTIMERVNEAQQDLDD